MQPPAVLAVHAGAGPAPDKEPDGGAARWPGQAAGLAAALRAGLAVLAGGGPSLEAVTAAVTVLEDDEHWNAGRGSALTAAGTVEMDAAVADGQGRRIGGEACLRAWFAHEVDARLRLEGVDLDTACQEALAAVTTAGGDGGCIAVAGDGPPVLPFTTALMHRGWAEVGGPLWVAYRPGPLERIE